MRFIPRTVIDQQHSRDAEHRHDQRDTEGASDRLHRHISFHAINLICNSCRETKLGSDHGSSFRAHKTDRLREPFSCFDSVTQRPARNPGWRLKPPAPTQFP
jgi:hypothetical protein